MKAIKLSIVALATILTFGIANAQVGIQAGYSSQTVTTTVGSTSASENLHGFHIGPVYEMNVQGPVSLTYGLFYNYMTGDWEGDKAVLHQLDLPVRIKVGAEVANDISLFGFAGPNFSLALSEKVGDTNLKDVPNPTDSSKKLYSPFDLQLGVGAGVKIKMLTIKASYDWGLFNRTTMGDAMVVKANDLKISLAYNF